MELDFALQLFAAAEADAAPANEAAAAPEAGAEDTSPAPEGEGEPAGEPAEAPAPVEAPAALAVTQDPPPEGKPAADGEQRARLLASVSAALEETQKNAALSRVISAWEAEAEETKALYLGFDLKTEARENADFAALLKAGVGVRRAYEAAHLEAILGAALRYAAVTAGKKTAHSVLSQSGRVPEYSVLDRASSMAHRDVNSLTGPDILKILDAVSRGATIKF